MVGSTVMPALDFIRAASSPYVSSLDMKRSLLGWAGRALSPDHEGRVGAHESAAEDQRGTQVHRAGPAGDQIEVVADVGDVGGRGDHPVPQGEHGGGHVEHRGTAIGAA